VDVEVERFGKKTETIRSCAQVAHPIIGFVVQDEQGWLALPRRASIPPSKERSRHDAIDYIRRSA
jgi:hypothetical protein